MKIKDNPEERAKLVKLRHQIRQLLHENDIGGLVILQAPDSADYAFELTPSWSCLEWRMEGDRIVGARIKAAVKTGGAGERKRLDQTVGMILSIIELATEQVDVMRQIIAMVSRGREIEHGSQRMPEE